MNKTTSFFGALLVIGLLAGCDPKKSTEVHGPSKPGSEDASGSGSGKPISDTPPHFREDQFQLGQWVQWIRKSNTGHQECERWQVVGIENYSVEVIALFSNDCQNWSKMKRGHIVFNRTSGDLIVDTIETGNVARPGFLDRIEDRWYGLKDKKDFQLGKVSLGKLEFPAFKIKELKPVYWYSLEAHAFRGIALQFDQDEGNTLWRYAFHSSNPPLKAAELLKH